MPSAFSVAFVPTSHDDAWSVKSRRKSWVNRAPMKRWDGSEEHKIYSEKGNWTLYEIHSSAEWRGNHKQWQLILVWSWLRHREWNQAGSSDSHGANTCLHFNHDWVRVLMCLCRFDDGTWCSFIWMNLFTSRSHYSYIMLGALLFKSWEGWDLLDSSYFCFISLSSIGFGDLVPGESVSWIRKCPFHMQINCVPNAPLHIWCTFVCDKSRDA